MNLYYAITKELKISVFELDGYSASEYVHIGNYFFAESRGKAKSALIRYAKADSERIDVTDIASVKLVSKNVKREAGICDLDDSLHPYYDKQAQFVDMYTT
jgi:hypothetical protein